MQEAAELGVVRRKRSQRLEAVDHDDAWTMFPDQRGDAFEHRGETVLVHGVAEIVVEHRSADLSRVEERHRLPESQQLVEGF